VRRSPHEGFFRPDGRELWVTVRGEDYLSIIDPVQMMEVWRIKTANGPGMVLFRPDGRYAFVPSSFTPECDVIDTATYQVIERIPQYSPFSPNLAVDQNEVWFTLKDTGRTQIFSAEPPFKAIATLETGSITNHVAFVQNSNGSFAYVTVGGEDKVLVYKRTPNPQPSLIATIPTGDLPHGIWGSGDGARIYVGLENGDAVQAIDTHSNQVIATIPVGQLPQALIYAPGATNSEVGNANLEPLDEAAQSIHLEMAAPEPSTSRAHASVSINSLGMIDNLQIAATGLEPGKAYLLVLLGDGPAQVLLKFAAGVGGTAIVQTLGPLKRLARGTSDTPHLSLQVRSAVAPDDRVVLAQIP
jgi:YVTN family beta-propeller protein